MTTAYDPPDVEAYNDKYTVNYRTEGYGLEGLRIRFPCPFCAEPDYMAGLLIGFEDWAADEHTCAYCRRRGRLVFTRSGAGVTAKGIQTGGDDPPEYVIHYTREASR